MKKFFSDLLYTLYAIVIVVILTSITVVIVASPLIMTVMTGNLWWLFGFLVTAPVLVIFTEK
jgi:hypothetical protein